MVTAADKIRDGVTANLKLIGNTMPVAMVLPDAATAQFAADVAKGRPGCTKLTFKVSTDTYYKSIEGLI